MLLPKRRKPQRSGIARAARREFPKHRKFVRSHECCVPGCIGAGNPIEFAHARVGTDGGAALKPSDWWGISLCHHHHWIQHQWGEPAFEAQFGLDMKKLAAEFARLSPDKLMLEEMKKWQTLAP